MAGKDFGGIMRLSDSAGNQMSLRGTFTVKPAGLSVESVTNQDGSSDRTATPTSATAEINFADKNVDLAALMRLPRRKISLTEDFTGSVHLFTDGFFTGDPEIDRMTGEVSGVGIACDAGDYRKILMAPKTVKLSRTYAEAGEPFDSLTFREPKWAEYVRTGPVEEWQPLGAGGQLALIENRDAMAEYANSLMVGRDSGVDARRARPSGRPGGGGDDQGFFRESPQGGADGDFLAFRCGLLGTVVGLDPRRMQPVRRAGAPGSPGQVAVDVLYGSVGFAVDGTDDAIASKGSLFAA